jgi:hypothetical protein
MDNLSFKYRPLALIALKQPYYSNGVCKKYQTEPMLDFELMPTDECQTLMRRLDIVFRRDDTQASCILLTQVLGSNASGDDLLRFSPQPGDKLSFWIRLNNPNVLNFDDLAMLNSASGLYYFSNQQTDTGALRNNLHLSQDVTGVMPTKDGKKRSLSIYRFHHVVAVATGKAFIQHELTGWKVEPSAILNQNGQSDLTFNLSVFPIGMCQLLINGLVADEFYYSGDLGFAVFGVIELLLTDTLIANYRIKEPDNSLTALPPVFTILFKNRKTRWRYTLHMQPNSPLFLELAALNAADKADFLNKLNIISNDTTITFKLSFTSDTDIVFVSDTDVLLKEKYVSSTSITHDPLSLTLKKFIGDLVKESIVRSDLPYPQTELIDTSTPSVIYSDIFITI